LASNYYNLIKQKLLELLSLEFTGHEARVFLEDNAERFGYGGLQIILDVGEKVLVNRWSNYFVYDYGVDIIVRDRVVSEESSDTDITAIVERIEERLIEKNRNLQASPDSLWFDSRIESVDPPDVPELEGPEDEEDVMVLAKEAVLHWVGTIGFEPASD
jgi:hypothetical protein